MPSSIEGRGLGAALSPDPATPLTGTTSWTELLEEFEFGDIYLDVPSEGILCPAEVGGQHLTAGWTARLTDNEMDVDELCRVGIADGVHFVGEPFEHGTALPEVVCDVAQHGAAFR